MGSKRKKCSRRDFFFFRIEFTVFLKELQNNSVHKTSKANCWKNAPQGVSLP